MPRWWGPGGGPAPRTRALVGAPCVATESVLRSRFISCFVRAGAAMTMNTGKLIGMEVPTSAGVRNGLSSAGLDYLGAVLSFPADVPGGPVPRLRPGDHRDRESRRDGPA